MFLFFNLQQKRERRNDISFAILKSNPSWLNDKAPLQRQNFEELDQLSFKERYRFSKDEAILLHSKLLIENEITLENGAKIDSKIALVVMLDKLARPTRLVDLQHRYGIEKSVLSRVINYMLEIFIGKFSHTIQIRHCLIAKYGNNLSQSLVNSGCPLSNCIGFIDGTCRQMCRPTRNQKYYYNGHKRFHYLKYQGVVAPNGIIIDLSGPAIGIRHDLRMMGESNIVSRLPDPLLWSVYGDPAYYHAEKVVAGFPGAILNDEQNNFNRRMSKARISDEWSFGGILNLWTGLRMVKDFKVDLQPVALYYKTATILYNIHNIMHPNQISQYFNCPSFTLEDYLHVYTDNCEIN